MWVGDTLGRIVIEQNYCKHEPREKNWTSCGDRSTDSAYNSESLVRLSSSCVVRNVGLYGNSSANFSAIHAAVRCGDRSTDSADNSESSDRAEIAGFWMWALCNDSVKISARSVVWFTVAIVLTIRPIIRNRHRNRHRNAQLQGSIVQHNWGKI